MAGFGFDSLPPTAAVHGDTGGFQVAADGLATDRERLLDAPKRPPQPPECEDLLLLGVVQDVAHAGDRTCVLSRRQRLDRYREWPVFSCRLMAGFGCPPRVYSYLQIASWAC
jgi:hypothetical protein